MNTCQDKTCVREAEGILADQPHCLTRDRRRWEYEPG